MAMRSHRVILAMARAAGTVDADSLVPRTLGAEGAGTFEGRPVVVYGHGVGTTRDGIWSTT